MNESTPNRPEAVPSAGPSYTVPAPLPPQAPEPLSRRDWLAPLLALCLGWLYVSVFRVDTMLSGSYGPGIGVTAFVFAFFIAVSLILGRRMLENRAGLWLMAAALALSVSCGLWAHLGMTVLNCFVILALSAAAVFQLSGAACHSWREAGLLPETFFLSIQALFSRLGRPVQALRMLKKNKSSGLGGFLLGLVIALPVLAVVILLLGSADAVFRDLFDRLGRRLSEAELSESLWTLFQILFWAALICSGLHFIGAPPAAKAPQDRERSPRTALPFLSVTLLLDAVYLLFVAIQITHLFGGREAAAMAGGWAEYARTGFFQLAAVTLINLCVCLIPAHRERYEARGGKLLRIAGLVMTALSFVILASAWWRMHLYIQAFGLSLLRLMTLWGMIVIAVLLGASVYKLLRPDFRFFPVLLGFAVSTWCVFCLMGPVGITANYNVNAYLDGRLESVDVSYLSSPDALPALYRLEQAEPEYDGLLSKIWELERECDPENSYQWHWSRWHASFLGAGQ